MPMKVKCFVPGFIFCGWRCLQSIFFMFYERNGSIIVADEMSMSTFDALVNIFSSECKLTHLSPLQWCGAQQGMFRLQDGHAPSLLVL